MKSGLQPSTWLWGIIALLILAFTWPTRAEGRDGRDVNRAWGLRCSRETGLQLRELASPAGHSVMLVRAGDGSQLKVDVTGPEKRALRRIGKYGLSPVGDFPDWKNAPSPMRQAFDALSGCVRRDPSLKLSGAFERGSVKPPTSKLKPAPGLLMRLPWLLLCALLGAAATVTLELYRARHRRRRARTLLALFALFGSCLAARWVLLPHAYLHPNGQGPLWVMYALGDAKELSSYGRGYVQVFGAAAHALGRPEVGLFAMQALLAACVAPASWVIARRTGASPVLAAALAAMVALDPVLGRMAQSESYLATCTSLFFLAAAVLAEGAWHVGARRLRFYLAVLSAGLFIALAARIHPVCWVAAALVPAVVVLQRGSLRRRLLLALEAAAGIGLVVLALGGRALFGVIRGSLGRKYMPSAHVALLHRALPLVAGVALIGVVALVVVRRRLRWRRVVLALTVAALTSVTLAVTNLLNSPNPSIAAAYWRMSWPVGLAVVACLSTGLFRSRRAQRWAGLGVAILAVGHTVQAHRFAFEEPTDVQEELWAGTWRSELPPGSVVIYLQRAGSWIQVLPLYGTRTFGLTRGDPPPEPGEKDVYYYRSSLCSSSDGRSYCRALERHYSLEPLVSRVLPAVPSMRWLHYEASAVRVGLYRVRARVAGTLGQ